MPRCPAPPSCTPAQRPRSPSPCGRKHGEAGLCFEPRSAPLAARPRCHISEVVGGPAGSRQRRTSARRQRALPAPSSRAARCSQLDRALLAAHARPRAAAHGGGRLLRPALDAVGSGKVRPVGDARLLCQQQLCRPARGGHGAGDAGGAACAGQACDPAGRPALAIHAAPRSAPRLRRSAGSEACWCRGSTGWRCRPRRRRPGRTAHTPPPAACRARHRTGPGCHPPPAAAAPGRLERCPRARVLCLQWCRGRWWQRAVVQRAEREGVEGGAQRGHTTGRQRSLPARLLCTHPRAYYRPRTAAAGGGRCPARPRPRAACRSGRSGCSAGTAGWQGQRRPSWVATGLRVAEQRGRAAAHSAGILRHAWRRGRAPGAGLCRRTSQPPIVVHDAARGARGVRWWGETCLNRMGHCATRHACGCNRSQGPPPRPTSFAGWGRRRGCPTRPEGHPQSPGPTAAAPPACCEGRRWRGRHRPCSYISRSARCRWPAALPMRPPSRDPCQLSRPCTRSGPDPHVMFARAGARAPLAAALQGSTGLSM